MGANPNRGNTYILLQSNAEEKQQGSATGVMAIASSMVQVTLYHDMDSSLE